MLCRFVKLRFVLFYGVLLVFSITAIVKTNSIAM